MYKLYLDKDEDFTAEVSVKNASLKNSFVRLIVESSDNINLVFNGHIEGDKCIIPIRKLKGILNENSHGKIHLEVVVEEIFFKPWESDFIVEEHTSVKVNVNEQIKESTKPKKPIVEIKIPSQSIENNLVIPLMEIISLCSIFQLNRKNIQHKKEDLFLLLKEYFNSNPEYKNKKTEILKHINSVLK